MLPNATKSVPSYQRPIRRQVPLLDKLLIIVLRSVGEVAVVDLATRVDEFFCLLAHPDSQRFFGFEALFFGVVANVLRYLH